MNKRVLLVSAMLRCINAAVEFAPEDTIKKNAIQQIRNDRTMNLLTQLCATTGWIKGNIGAKYLKIVCYGLLLPISTESESPQNLQMYELVCKALGDILNIVRQKLMNEDKLELTKDDKILIYQVKTLFNSDLNDS